MCVCVCVCVIFTFAPRILLSKFYLFTNWCISEFSLKKKNIKIYIKTSPKYFGVKSYTIVRERFNLFLL